MTTAQDVTNKERLSNGLTRAEGGAKEDIQSRSPKDKIEGDSTLTKI